MRHPLYERWADVLVRYSLAVQPGQVISLEGAPLAEPLLRELHAAVLRAGGHPVLALSLPSLERDFLQLANDDQLARPSPISRLIMEQFDGRIVIRSGDNTRSLSRVDPARQARRQQANRPLFDRFMARSAAGELRWVVTLFPTNAYAQDAGMALEEFGELVERAALLDTPDPVAAWREQSARQARLIDVLKDKEQVHIVGEGTDLRLSIKGRRWINADGHRNFPDGEVFTGPVEDSAEGIVTFAVPAAHAGRLVEGVRLRFVGGRVVEASARANDAYLQHVLALDEGARRLGEFAFGTNYGVAQPTHDVLLDEKMGGTIHLALGASYAETGGVNQSALHLDLVCDLRDGGAATVDGAPFLTAGRYTVA